MLLSMTGHGESSCHRDGLAVAAEVRTVNNRYFKLSVRSSERYAALEPKIEAVVRQFVRRGTVQVNLRIDREASPDDYRLNEIVLTSYRRQMERLHERLHVMEPIPLGALLTLPGVVVESESSADVEADWPLIVQALSEALARLTRMRTDEGNAMQRDLVANNRAIAAVLDRLETRAPQVVEAYRQRLMERLTGLLAGFDVQVQAADVVREVGVFAERCDVSEEFVRLRSHLEQFATIVRDEESPGRKLEFLTQEMLRETNTIGSKANDAEIAHHVVEIKTAIERMREMIQNVE